MTKKYIRELIEPRNDSSSSRIYDWFMLVAIVVGILPLLFREQSILFFFFFLFSGLCFDDKSAVIQRSR